MITPKDKKKLRKILVKYDIDTIIQELIDYAQYVHDRHVGREFTLIRKYWSVVIEKLREILVIE